MSEPCVCSNAPDADGPASPFNRPGLSALAYRTSRYESALQAMRARLAHRYASLSADRAVSAGPDGRPALSDVGDPVLALLDAWSVTGDVLGFYMERIANEGFIRTATERQSILALTRLIGYVSRPGVAASVYLAYGVQDLGNDADVTIPSGSKVQSMPVAGEMPPSFETGESFIARSSWSKLTPRSTRPQKLAVDASSVYLQGSSTSLKPNDPLLIVNGSDRRLRRVASVEPDLARKRIKVNLQGSAAAVSASSRSLKADELISRSSLLEDSSMLNRLGSPAASHPANAVRLRQRLSDTMRAGTDVAAQLLVGFQPALTDNLYAAIRSAPVAGAADAAVYQFKVHAAPFGNNAPLATLIDPQTGQISHEEWELTRPFPYATRDGERVRHAEESVATEDGAIVFLDNAYESIVPGSDSWVVVDRAVAFDGLAMPLISTIDEVSTVSRADYGLSAKVTRIKLGEDKRWLEPSKDRQDFAGVIRGSALYAGSERLVLAEEDISEPIAGDSIELLGVVDGLQPGRWLLVSGERADLSDVTGISGSEVVMLLVADHGTAPVAPRSGSPGDSASPQAAAAQEPVARTTLRLANPLAYKYRPGSVTVYGNVVPATHGESRSEVLGSGDGRASLRELSLRQGPLTYVSAATPNGATSTLSVTVDGVEWTEVESLRNAGPNDQVFMTRPGVNGMTRVTFGDGRQGARLPAGVENVRANYRVGLGVTGNSSSGAVTLLATRPQGVKDVVNPIAASGGADPETSDEIRRKAGQGLGSLDRLVSLSDYTDFSLAFAGVGKASAVRLRLGSHAFVHVTIAGAADAAIGPNDALPANLLAALHQFGDPQQPVRVQAREALFIVISANVGLTAGGVWEDVEPRIRAAALAAFGFSRRALGQDVMLSEVLAVMQAVEGVSFVDVDTFDSVAQATLKDDMLRIGASPRARPNQRIVVRPARVEANASHPGSTLAAQIAYLTADVPATLVLTEANP